MCVMVGKESNVFNDFAAPTLTLTQPNEPKDG